MKNKKKQKGEGGRLYINHERQGINPCGRNVCVTVWRWYIKIAPLGKRW